MDGKSMFVGLAGVDVHGFAAYPARKEVTFHIAPHAAYSLSEGLDGETRLEEIICPWKTGVKGHCAPPSKRGLQSRLSRLTGSFRFGSHVAKGKHRSGQWDTYNGRSLKLAPVPGRQMALHGVGECTASRRRMAGQFPNEIGR